MRHSVHAAVIAKWAAVPAALVVSGLLVSQASYSAFSATTNNAGNNWASGSLALTNDASGTALFSASNIKPGDAGSKCITVSTTANIASTLKVYASSYSKGTKSLGDRINVTVTSGSFPGAAPANGACTGFTAGSVAVATTSLTSFAAASSSYATGADSYALPAGGSRTYKIDWTFATAGSTSADNAYQGDTASIGFTWESQS
ncbi:hypothetical protein [Arthrobacter celericrescens]|uniref:hypothetical protein n=1 Tax=Arthrobacter celericrescens TaxID=2320851 RepID=UPI000EA140ED|nr:hypothetical protein [Arthrobacter celericrescens]